MTDWIGTAAATLTVAAKGPSRLAYQYQQTGTGVDPAYYNVSDGGTVLIVGTNGPNVTFKFSACWVGTFEGSAQAVDECTKRLSGTYELLGASDECFGPPRAGTFALNLNTCQ